MTSNKTDIIEVLPPDEVRRIASEAGLRPIPIARAAGLPRTTVYMFLRGKREHIRLSTLRRISEVVQRLARDKTR